MIPSRSSVTVFDLPRKRRELEQLKQQTSQEDFWRQGGGDEAKTLLQRLHALEEEVTMFDALVRECGDLVEIAEEAGDDEALRADIDAQFQDLRARYRILEHQTLFSGPYDREPCILALHAGTGGVDAQDWTGMLMRMYMRFCERKGWKVEVFDEKAGAEAGMKSVVLNVKGSYAYGHLKAEAGVHRLVRLSPFNADALRQTSFALLEVMPVFPEMGGVEIRDEDLKIDTYRSSGAGGQHVNKTDSAVRITHMPTGIVVGCQSERSQIQNREHAMTLLRAKLHAAQLEMRRSKEEKLRGEYHAAEWGNQIRSYVLHPYTMVKDHRTKHETSNVQRVLDGDLDDFIDSWLRAGISKKT